jgi:ABC-type xylose transport system substrate-binding protein
MDDHEKNLMTGTLEQRKDAFKEDEELMRETTKFISEVIETATTEASKRKVHSEVMNSRTFLPKNVSRREFLI